ncbi:bestrophin-like domain [Mycobacterium sp. C31M]
MSAWLVGHIPAGLLLVALIVLISGGAVLLQRMVRHRFPHLSGEDHNDVTRFTYGVIGFVYAFFIGFVVSAMWGHINTADTNSRAEGAAAVQLARDAVIFETADAERVHTALLAYGQAALDEWPGVGGESSERADRALADVYLAYGQVRTITDTQKSRLATSLSNLDKVSQARTVRTLQARDDDGAPWPLWAVIFLTSALVLGTAIIYGVEKPSLHYPMVAIVGVLVATNLFLVLQLAHPFIGDAATSADPLREFVAVLQRPSG